MAYKKFIQSIFISGDGILVQELDGFIPKGLEQKIRLPSDNELDKLEASLKISRKRQEEEKSKK